MIRLLLLCILSLTLSAQTRTVISTGTAANTGSGDSLRLSMLKINTNFTTLFATIYTNGASVGVIRTSLSTNVLTGKVIIDGSTSSQAIEFRNLLRLDGTAKDVSITGVNTAYYDGGVTTLRGVTNLNLITPGVRLATAVTGQFLRLTDATEGKVEFVEAFQVNVATLVAGTVTVTNTGVTANSRFLLTGSTPGGTPGWHRVSARVNGVSFTILSSSGTDTSVVSWMRIEP